VAVIKKIPQDTLLMSFGVAGDAVAKVAEHGIQTQVTPSKIVFVLDGEVVANVPVAHDVASKIADGTMVPSDKIKALMASAVGKALASAPDKAQPVSTLDYLKNKAKPVTQKTVKTVPVVEEAPPKPGNAVNSTDGPVWPTLLSHEMVSMAPVKLRDAMSLYQPVTGTSDHSKYFVVAGNEQVRVAARYKIGSLSIRVEGPDLQQMTTDLYNAGFDSVKKDKDYASVHVQIASDIEARRALYTVIGALPGPWRTLCPDLARLKGKGL
jgi:hypothetical protein